MVLGIIAGHLLWLAPQPTIASETSDHVDITITAIPNLYGILPITDLTLTDLGFVNIQADWTPGGNYTMLRGFRDYSPTSASDALANGELIYYGPESSYNITGMMLDIYHYEIVALTFATDNVTYLETYDTATIGGEGVEEIATGLETLATTGDTFAEIGSLAIQVVIVLVMLTFAIWAKDIIFYYVAGAVTCYISYTLVQDYPGLGLPALFLGGYQFVRALLLTFSDGGPSRGVSQFKGVYNTIKGWFQ